VPVKVWQGLGGALQSSPFWLYVPAVMRPGLQLLWESTAPVVCSMGATLWGLKEAASAALKAGLVGVITDKALTYAMGSDVKKNVLAAAHLQLGTTTLTERYGVNVSAMADAIARKDRAAYDRAKNKAKDDMNGYLSIDDSRFVDLLGTALKQSGNGVLDKLKDLAKSKLVELTKDTIDPPLKAAKGSLGSVPYAGGLLVTVVGYAEDYLLNWLYGYFLDSLEQPLLQMYNQAIDLAIPELKRALAQAGSDVRAGFRMAFGAIKEVKASFDADRARLVARITQNIADLDRAMATASAH
jgi:hypothetical protein